MFILGVSCYYHDSAAVLLKDGQLIAAAEEERFSRVKHDNGYPKHAIEFCLKQAGITAKDLDYVVFYEKPLVKFERILMTTLGGFPGTYPVFRESMVAWFNEKLWAKSRLRADLDIDPKKILFVEHHLSHAASALFASPFEEAAVLTIDGVGEWTTATIGHGTAAWQQPDGSIRGENKIDLTQEIQLPAFTGPVVFGLHGLAGLSGQRRRVQGHGHGALWHAALSWMMSIKLIECRRRWQFPVEHGLLQFPLFDQEHLQPEVRRSVRRSRARPNRSSIRRSRIPRKIIRSGRIKSRRRISITPMWRPAFRP